MKSDIANNWRIVIAPDSFKGSLNALEVGEAMEKGILLTLPEAETVVLPIADGGEGTVDAVLRGRGGRKVEIRVTGPLGIPVDTYYGILPDGETAVLEMASASGLPLVPVEKRDPRVTTTYGTGELIKSAVEQGVKKIILGIGGSATNDGGAGMAQALGIKLLDEEGKSLPYGGAALAQLHEIDISGCHPGVRDVEIIAACDVENPLCGPKGASAVYGPQKGADPEMVAMLDEALANMAKVLKSNLGKDVAEIPGAGAAGGLGAGLLGFLGASLKPGFVLLAELLQLEEQIKQSDIVVTGEGFIDQSTVYGKVPAGIARTAAACGVPVIAIGGGLGKGIEQLYDLGINGLYPATTRPMALEEAMSQASEFITLAARNAFELVKTGLQMKK